MVATSAGPPTALMPGRLRANPLWVDGSVAILSDLFMRSELGFDGPEKPHLGGHLGRQVGEGDAGVLAIEL